MVSLSSVPVLPRPLVGRPAPSRRLSRRPLRPIAATMARRVFTDYKIYKGKAAVSFQPIRPTYAEFQPGCVRVERQGAVLLEFAPAAGRRQYEWGKKLTIALSPVEVGELLEAAHTGGCEFLHDPLMGSPQAGAVYKKLHVSPQKEGGGGFFFSLDVKDSKAGFSERLSVPVTRGEYAVLRSMLDFLLPHLLGFDALVDPSILPPPEPSAAGGRQRAPPGAGGGNGASWGGQGDGGGPLGSPTTAGSGGGAWHAGPAAALPPFDGAGGESDAGLGRAVR